MTVFQKLAEEMRRNRRLQVGLLLITLVVLADRAAAWADRIEKNQKTLTQLQIEVATLKSQARNEAAMQATMQDIRKAAALADARLWVVSSEAVGQARLKDWLTEQMKQAGVSNYSVNVASPKPVMPARGLDAGVQNPAAPQEGGTVLLEFSAALTFTLTPESLEKMLQVVEAGEAMSKVESVSVRRNDRRVELGVRVLMRLKESSP